MYSYINIHIHKVYTNRSPKQWHPLVPRTRSLDCCPWGLGFWSKNRRKFRSQTLDKYGRTYYIIIIIIIYIHIHMHIISHTQRHVFLIYAQNTDFGWPYPSHDWWFGSSTFDVCPGILLQTCHLTRWQRWVCQGMAAANMSFTCSKLQKFMGWGYWLAILSGSGEDIWWDIIESHGNMGDMCPKWNWWSNTGFGYPIFKPDSSHKLAATILPSGRQRLQSLGGCKILFWLNKSWCLNQHWWLDQENRRDFTKNGVGLQPQKRLFLKRGCPARSPMGGLEVSNGTWLRLSLWEFERNSGTIWALGPLRLMVWRMV